MARAKVAHKHPVSASEDEPTISTEQREHMIAEAAYFRALARSFSGGDPVEDWLAAEREITRLLTSPQRSSEPRAEAH